MNREQWLNIAEWMVPRWTQTAAWEPAVWDAMYQDLAPYAAADVQRMLHRIWQSGREFPPKATTILAMLHEFRCIPESTGPPALPEPPTVTLGDYLTAQGYGSIKDLFDQYRKGEP